MAADQDDFLQTGLRAITNGDTPPTDSECTICLHDLQLGQGIDQIRTCGHAFHKPCLLSWLNSRNKQHSTCPNCRQELFPTRHPSHSNSAEIIARIERERRALEDRMHRLDIRFHGRSRYGPAAAPSGSSFASQTTNVRTGLDLVLACITPHPTTGEYTTVETRFRSYWEQILPPNDVDVANTINDLWNTRNAFVRNIERLEYLYSRFGPLQARQTLGPLIQGNVAEGAVTATPRMREEFDSLLNKLMPCEVHRDVNTSMVSMGLSPNLRVCARLFSLLSPTEEAARARSAKEAWSSMAAMYPFERRHTLEFELLGRHRLSRFVDSGVYRHYVDTETEQGRHPTSFPSHEQIMSMPLRAARAYDTPGRTTLHPISSSTFSGLGRPRHDPPSTPSRWRPGMSPFRSPADETMSLGVSWSDGSPRGVNAELMDPEYLRWREEQGGPSIFNSPIAMVTGGHSRDREGTGVRKRSTSHDDNYRFGRMAVGSPLARRERPSEIERSPPPTFATSTMPTLSGLHNRTPGLYLRPPQITKPSLEPPLRPEEMSERRIAHEAFFDELQRLELGPEAQMESVRLFPRQSIYDCGVQSDPIAQCAFMMRVLQKARQTATVTPGPACESRDQDSGDDDGALV
jgi:hypothetical protein